MNASLVVGRTRRAMALCLVGAGLACTPADCQVATVATFEPALMPASSEQGGPARRGPADFALHDLDSGGTPKRRVDIMPEFRSRSPAVSPDFSATRMECGFGTPPSPHVLPLRALVGRRRFWPLIAKAECRFGLPKGLMDSVVLAESGYDPSILSPAGAAGLAQLMPATALQLGVVDRFDPGANVMAGARYLRQLLDSFGGNVRLALAAYNAGPKAVRDVGGVPMNGETPGYVRRVLSYWTAPSIGQMNTAMPARQLAQMLGFMPNASGAWMPTR